MAIIGQAGIFFLFVHVSTSNAVLTTDWRKLNERNAHFFPFHWNEYQYNTSNLWWRSDILRTVQEMTTRKFYRIFSFDPSGFYRHWPFNRCMECVNVCYVWQFSLSYAWKLCPSKASPSSAAATSSIETIWYLPDANDDIRFHFDILQLGFCRRYYRNVPSN